MEKRITVVENILGANDRMAQANLDRIEQAKVFGINVMASPGAGKTSLIEHTIRELAGKLSLLVVDGDIATSIDADRAAAAGAIAVQVNTGGECHMDATMLQSALEQINLQDVDLLVVENVGNLICPASFPLGVHKNIMVASIPEGDDKPYKYPTMYRGVDALVINKIDLLPYVEFNMEYFQRGVSTLNPGLITFQVSCKTGEGISDWITWLTSQVTNRWA